jgi:hypothetical protein
MFKIEKPGIYFDVSAADYFEDPCPSASLTQSVAKVLLEKSPLHAWTAHPRLNPDWLPDNDTKFDVGNIAHKLMLGRGKDIVVLDDFDDWRTKAAKEARADAAKEGKLAVLGYKFHLADEMVKAAREQLEHRELGYLFSSGGQSEVVAAWQEGDIWLRQMIDWLSLRIGTGIFVDYKTTDMSVAPHLLGKQMVGAGWHIQGAMGERALDVLDPASKGKRNYLFVVQETEKPYCLNVVEIGADPLTMGRKQIDTAVSIWRRCIETDRWPGYPAEIVTPEMPGWFEQQILDREIHEAAQARVPQNGRHADNLLAG